MNRVSLATEPAKSSGITYGREARAAILGPFVIIETHHRARARLPRHDHAQPSLNIALSGAFVERVAARDFNSSAGTLVVKPSGAHHANRYGAIPTVSVLVQPLPPALAEMRHCARAFGEVRTRTNTAVLRLGEQLRAHLHGRALPSFELELLLEDLLFDLSGCVRSPSSSQGVPRWLKRIREAIHERGVASLSVGNLAREEGVSPVTLAKAFRRAYACTPSEMIREVRIDRAREILSASSRTLADVAMSTGFADQAHFTRAFKRETAMTPGEYCRRHRRSL